MDNERNRLRTRAAGAAWTLAEAAAHDGHADEARQWGQWAASLTPDDERALRRLVSLLLGMDDRAGALRAYDRFAQRLATEFDAQPAEETRQLIASARDLDPGGMPSRHRAALENPASGRPASQSVPAMAAVPVIPTTIASLPTAMPAPPPRAPVHGRRWLWIVMGAAAAASVLATYGATAERHANETATIAPPPSSTIAVMPFDNLGPGHDDDYFADAMTEELITRLARVNGLRVVGRSSAFSFKGKAEKAQDIGRALGAAMLLEGSVEREGQRLRIRSELIDAAQGYTVWAQSYDRNLEDVFAVQDELTAAIVGALGRRFGALQAPAARAHVGHDTLAYTMYLRAQYFSVRHDEPAMKLALQYFARALARDSNYAEAYAGIAGVYASLAGQGYIDSERGRTLARLNALKALALDSTLAAAYRVLGFISLYQEWRGDSADAELRKALALDLTDQGALMLHALYYIAVNRPADASAEARRSMAVDPLSLLYTARGAQVLCWARRNDEAAEAARHAVEMDSTYGPGYWALGAVLMQEHRVREAIPLFRRAETLTGLMQGDLGYAYAVSGDTTAAHHYLDAMARFSRTHYVDPYERALVFAGLQQSDSAMHWLERAYELHSGHLIYLRTQPMLNILRQDPRFVALVRKVGL